MFQSRSYSSQIWRPLTFHQTLIDISWVLNRLAIVRAYVSNTTRFHTSGSKDLTWYACYVSVLISRLSMETRKKKVASNACPRVSRNSIKTRYACGSQLSKVMKPLDFTSKCRHNLKKTGQKKKGLWCEKDPKYNSAVPVRKTDNAEGGGHRHRSQRQMKGDKWRWTDKGLREVDTGTKGAKQMKQDNPPSSPSFQANKPNLYRIYPISMIIIESPLSYYGRSLFNIPISSHRIWSAQNPVQTTKEFYLPHRKSASFHLWSS